MGDGEGLIVFQKKNNQHHIMMWMRGLQNYKDGSLPRRKKGSPDALIPDALIPDGYFMLFNIIAKRIFIFTKKHK